MKAKLHATTVSCKKYYNKQKVYIYYTVDNDKLIDVSCNGCNFESFNCNICKSCKEICVRKFTEDWPILR